MNTRLLLGAGLALLAMTTSLPSLAEEPPPELPVKPWYKAGPGDEVSLNLPIDGAILLGAGGASIAAEILKFRLAPANCHWCDGPDNSGLPGDPNNGRADLNGVDAFFHDKLTGAGLSRKSYDTLSNVWVIGVLPVGAVVASYFIPGPKASSWSGTRNLVLVLESVTVAFTSVQATKFFAGRKRPFVRYGHGYDGTSATEGGTYNVNDRDSHISFPSGHTAIATATGVSVAELATLEGSPAAPYLWAGAVVGGVGAAVFRMGAEKHYFTDVSTGFALGMASGILVPWLHRKGGLLAQRDQTVAVVPAGDGAALVWSGSY